MGKKAKGRGRPKQVYLPGATWQDVLAGRPVTSDEAAADVRRKGRKPTRCDSCRRVDVSSPAEPCRKCGGRVRAIES